MEDALKSIYESNLRFLARWNTTSANHVTMAATAMYLMKDKAGLLEVKILGDATQYSMQLSPIRKNDSRIEIKYLPENIQDSLLGYDDLQESWQTYFEQIFNDNIESNIAIWFERLGAGLSAAAGHSLLRIYFALAVRDVLGHELLTKELAVAFADLATRYCELSGLPEKNSSIGLEKYLATHEPLSESDFRLVSSGKLIEDKLLVMKSLAEYKSATEKIGLDFDLINCLRVIAAITTESPNIGALHTITVGQALFEILQMYPSLNELPLRRGYRDFTVAVVLAYNLPNANSTVRNDVGLSEIYGRVSDLKNDHSQKSSFSLTYLYEKTGYPEFLSAAIKIQDVFR